MNILKTHIPITDNVSNININISIISRLLSLVWNFLSAWEIGR